MKGKSLRSAFQEMLLRPDVWHVIDLSKQTVLNRRVMMRKRIYPRDALMRRWLRMAGWKMVVEERWDKKARKGRRK